LREAGAAEVHVRISSPPVKWPCFYGIDFATRAELIANGLTTDEIRQSIGADSLDYIDIAQLVESTTVDDSRLCTACFTGKYPIELPQPEELGKHLLEDFEHSNVNENTPGADGLAVVVGGAGAEDALSRP